MLWTVSVAGPAAAHTDLVGSTPRAGDVVALRADRLVLVFSEELTGSAQVAVRGPGGGDAVVGPVSTRTDTVTARIDLRRPGRQVVTYRVLAGDGHLVTGELTFHARARDLPGAGPRSEAPDAAPAAVRAGPGGTTSTGDPLVEPARPQEDAPPAPAWWLGGAGAAVLAGWAGHRLLRRGPSDSRPG